MSFTSLLDTLRAIQIDWTHVSSATGPLWVCIDCQQQRHYLPEAKAARSCPHHHAGWHDSGSVAFGAEQWAELPDQLVAGLDLLQQLLCGGGRDTRINIRELQQVIKMELAFRLEAVRPQCHR